MKEHAAPDSTRKLSRRRLLKILAASFAGAGLSGSLYSYFIEPYWLVVESCRLTFHAKHNPPSGLRILHLSDLHRSDIVPASYLRECVTRGNALKPDLVLLTGDYITWRPDWAESVGEILSALEARLGIFASLGNHDGGEWAGFPSDTVRLSLDNAGIRVLVNESEQLSFGEVPFTVAGLGDLWAGDFDPEAAFDGVDARSFTVALSHNPDTVGSLRSCSANLILSGHTHGGQVWIPLLGPPLLPVEDRKYSAGIYREGEQVIYVNRGIGLLRKVRFNCRPEIALIEIA
jgi:predicted MPP superfamily phosphohydrolase